MTFNSVIRGAFNADVFSRSRRGAFRITAVGLLLRNVVVSVGSGVVVEQVDWGGEAVADAKEEPGGVGAVEPACGACVPRGVP